MCRRCRDHGSQENPMGACGLTSLDLEHCCCRRGGSAKRCIHLYYTSSTAQGGGGSFKNRKPIGEVGCCESGMAERIH